MNKSVVNWGIVVAFALIGVAISYRQFTSRGGLGEYCNRDGTCINGLVCHVESIRLDASLNYRCTLKGDK
jgi:hypothetical protein